MSDWIQNLPEVRGRILKDTPLAKITWLRVGGPADVLFMPADADDLAHFLKELPTDIPVLTIGIGSNLLVRDGGLRGVVIRLGPGFAKVATDGVQIRAGAAALDAMVAKRAAAAGIAGLEFYRGIPGTVGGALMMNAGAYGSETKDVLVEAVALDRQGKRHVFTNSQMGFTYRKNALSDGNGPDGLIFIEALYEGRAGDTGEITARMDEIMAKREASQPVKERTGGSTFKNPDPATTGGLGAWQLIDAVGGRGRVVGDAMFSELHCNFLINRGKASAADLETLGENVRSDVLREAGIDLHWEVKRVGEIKRAGEPG